MSGARTGQRADGAASDDVDGVSRRSFLGHSLRIVAGLSFLPSLLEGCGGRGATTSASKRKVVVFVQENHTTDNYFASMAPFGADVETGWPAGLNGGGSSPVNVAALPQDQTGAVDNSRLSYYYWLKARLTGALAASHVQYDATKLLPFYDYLAKTGTFFANHFTAFGADSTPNHMVILGGQATVLQNPSGKPPSWDLPSLPQLAQDSGRSWKGYAGKNLFPFLFYQSLAGAAQIVSSDQFANDARAGMLADLSLVFHDPPYDEHPPADITLGHDKIWQYVTAAVAGGEWAHTVFLLTWDDWGGFDDHVLTPVLEYTADNVQVAGGPRVPLLMFGGPVKGGIDWRWCSHAAIPKTVMQILGLPPLGVPRADNDPGLADRLDWTKLTPPPPAFGTTVVAPSPPANTSTVTIPPYPTRPPQPLAPVILRGGKTLPAPNDAPVPSQPMPPTSSDPSRNPALLGG